MSDHDPPAMTAGPKHRGVPITLSDGQPYVVPSLTFRQLEEHEGRLARAMAPNIQMAADAREDILVLAHAALSRNYPDLTVDALRDLLDLEAAGELAYAIAAVNQLREQLGRMVRSP